MKLGYTEFSFGYAFTENLIHSASLAPVGAPVFPNLSQEGLLGYDVKINLPASPLYFQYKLPELMVRKTATEISKNLLPGIQTPFFRMHLMRSSLSKQHQLLIDLERQYPNSVYYASPEMDSGRSFNTAYNAANVHLQSVLISPRNIGSLPDSKPHIVAYCQGSQYAWFCSEPREVRVIRFGEAVSRVRTMFKEPRYRSLTGVAQTTLQDMMHLAGPEFRNLEGVIRERIRARTAAVSEIADLGEVTMKVVEDLLVCREVTRVGLGLEFVVAQPSS